MQTYRSSAKTLTALPAALAFVAATLATSGANAQAPAAPFCPLSYSQPLFQYAVKFVCGVPTPTHLVPKPPVAKGEYYTAINVHNPRNDPIQFCKKFVEAKANEDPNGYISPWKSPPPALKADGAFEIDCPDILKNAHPPGTPVPTYLKGFVVIESRYELDVVAVYTAAAALNGPVVTMEIERVPKRPLP
jgi:hypothetical protein